MKRRPSEVIMYDRSKGCVCYAAPILGNSPAAWSTIGDRLLASGLQWGWESAPAHDPADRGGSPPRSLTPLHPQNAPQLTSDVSELDSDGYHRFIVLVAVEHAATARSMPQVPLRDLLRPFAAGEASDIGLVIVQVGDSPVEHVFVHRECSPAVTATLNAWGIAEDGIIPRRPYARLRTASLESMYSLE